MIPEVDYWVGAWTVDARVETSTCEGIQVGATEQLSLRVELRGGELCAQLTTPASDEPIEMKVTHHSLGSVSFRTDRGLRVELRIGSASDAIGRLVQASTEGTAEWRLVGAKQGQGLPL